MPKNDYAEAALFGKFAELAKLLNIYLNMLFPILGGNWSNSTNAGVWARNWNNNRTNTNNNVGFRSDYFSYPHSADCAEWKNRDVLSCDTRNRLSTLSW